jgi:hypothetical protein
MTITNHMLAGSIIGLALADKPILALILAVSSHFAMDALPHFGYPGRKGYSEALRHRLSYQVGVATVITTLALILFLVVKGEWFALLAGVLATLPDALGVYNYLGYEKHGQYATGPLKWVHVRFHRAIQRYERPWGVYVEVPVFLVLGTVLLALTN